MVKTLANNNTIIKQNIGIGENDGVMMFNKNKNIDTSSFLTPNTFHQKHLAKSFGKIKVPIITIDPYCKKNNIDRIKILKLDIEGFDWLPSKAQNHLLKTVRLILFLLKSIWFRVMINSHA